jgi:hypothetical protein
VGDIPSNAPVRSDGVTHGCRRVRLVGLAVTSVRTPTSAGVGT